MDWTFPRSAPCSGDSVITPLVVTGHQPELFHPGVWVKNFATAALARAHGGLGLNLIVDNDIPKSASIRVPRVGKDRIQMVRVEFDHWKGEMPYEDLTVHDEALSPRLAIACGRSLAGSSPTRSSTISGRVPCARRKAEPTLGMRLALARRELESNVGRLQPGDPPQPGLPDRGLLLVRVPSAGPASPIPADPQRSPGRVSRGLRHPQQEPSGLRARRPG